MMLQEQRLRYIKKEKWLNTNTKSVNNVCVCLFVFQLSVITRAWHSLRLLHHITKCLHELVKTVQSLVTLIFPQIILTVGKVCTEETLETLWIKRLISRILSFI